MADIAYSTSKIESAINCKFLALYAQSHCTIYLISGSIECSNSCIYWALRRSPLSLCWWGETMVIPDLPFTSTISVVMTWCPSKSSAHTTKWGPAKVLPIGPRTGNDIALGPLASQYTGKNTGILVEIGNRFFMTLWCKASFKTWCSTTQKRQKLVTEMCHKPYSSPEPQWRSNWQKLALFISFTNLC